MHQFADILRRIGMAILALMLVAAIGAIIAPQMGGAFVIVSMVIAAFYSSRFILTGIENNR